MNREETPGILREWTEIKDNTEHSISLISCVIPLGKEIPQKLRVTEIGDIEDASDETTTGESDSKHHNEKLISLESKYSKKYINEQGADDTIENHQGLSAYDGLGDDPLQSAECQNYGQHKHGP